MEFSAKSIKLFYLIKNVLRLRRERMENEENIGLCDVNNIDLLKCKHQK